MKTYAFLFSGQTDTETVNLLGTSGSRPLQHINKFLRRPFLLSVWFWVIGKTNKIVDTGFVKCGKFYENIYGDVKIAKLIIGIGGLMYL